MARVEAVVRRRRRSQPRVDAGPVVAAELEIRADQFQAFVAIRSVNLTRREFELLQTLAGANGKVLEREEIYQRVWGYAMAHGDRSVDVFIRKLRAKLQKVSPGWTYIHTHFGVGYRFEPEPEVPGSAEVPTATQMPGEVEGDLVGDLAVESVAAAEVGLDVGDAGNPAP
jgi:DNA-binding response OmpR family regulator